jgi:low molecular weight protein-tyrosine phosphatase
VAHVLVICTGNICRSPMAEGFLRSAFEHRLGAAAPTVDSAGTLGWEGSPAQAESIVAAREREVDIESHVARRVTPALIERADLVLTMAGEHRDEVVGAVPEATGRAFTLKELVRLVQALPPPAATSSDSLAARVAEADSLRRGGFPGNPRDEDIADPLGQPQDTYRAVAWELDDWIHRLADGLFGPTPAPVAIFGDEERG